MTQARDVADGKFTNTTLTIDSGSDNANTLLLSDGAADANIVDGFVTCRHHSSSEEPVLMIQGRSTSSENIVLVGGTHNNSTYNTATSIKFFTASGYTNTTPVEKMRVTGDGLTFNGDTAAANALDDYEEGDFTPELRASTTNPSSTVSGVGKYTKIGRTVTFNFIFSNKTISGAAGNIQIINMPFAPTGAINAIFPIASHNMNSPGTFSVGYLTGGGTTMEVLNMRDATSWQNVNISNVSAFYLFVGGSYTTSS